MIQLRVFAKLRDGGQLSTELAKRIARFEEQIATARREAAATATAKSKAAVKRIRPIADPRPGRNYEPIQNNLRWASGTSQDQDLVRLDTKSLDQKSRHWIIQNIGTGNSAVVHQAGRPNPQGRPAKDSTYVKSIKSQRGRRISAGLVFATGPAGQYTPPGQGSGQQLYLRSKVSGGARGRSAWTRTHSQPGIIIRREIRPQRFVQAGAKQGFRQYRESVLSAARTAFEKTG